MTLRETAEVLGVTERTVRNYLSKGLLASFRKPGSRLYWIDPVEVAEFKRDRDSLESGSSVSRGAILRLNADVRRLQADMKVVLSILDARSDPLRMSQDYARDLLGVCVAQLKVSKWEVSEIEPWAEIFLRIDEEDFLTISNASEEAKPWKPFLVLCLSMTAYVSTRPAYSSSLELQTIHRRLAEGRRRMRVAALIYTEMYTTTMDADLRRYALIDAPASVQDSLAQVLKAKKGR